MNNKKMYLSNMDKKISGVCGGIAEYMEMDSTIIRLIAVAACIFTGFLPVTIGYFVAAYIIPKKDLVE